MVNNTQATRIDKQLLLRFANAQRVILGRLARNALQDTNDRLADFIWACARDPLMVFYCLILMFKLKKLINFIFN
jgi:hypothetical protein